MYTDWGIPPERERPGLVACAADVRAGLEKQKENGRQASAVQLLDARAAAQFTGKRLLFMRVIGHFYLEAVLFVVDMSVSTSMLSS